MDVIFTIVSRNYAAQAATLMRSLGSAEPDARRVVVAADGPIPELGPLAEVIPAADLGAPVRDMSVYYEALELNTAVKPFVLRSLLAQPGVDSVTYLDPDIFVFRPLDAVRAGLAEGPVCLTPHLTRPLTTPGQPSNAEIAASGTYNLGFLSVRRDPDAARLLDWWAERCRFDCRVDPQAGIFTDQKWMEQAPAFVPGAVILTDPGLNLAYWNLEGRKLSRGADGWRVDGGPLTFFHFSGFDPDRPLTLSKHQNRLAVERGSALADLLADYARALKANGHAEARARGYAFDRFASGRRVTPAMRRAALDAARSGESFPDGLGPATEAWMDAEAPDAPGLTRVQAAVARERPAAAYAWWFIPNVEALGADHASAEAALRLDGPADPARRYAGDELLAWRIGPEAVAGRSDTRALSDPDIERLLASPAILAHAAELAETDARPTDLRRALFAAFGLPHRAGWPDRLKAPLQAPHLAPAAGLPRPFTRLFRDIWDSRADLQRLYPLGGFMGRLRYLRWLVAGGFAEYGLPLDALPPSVRNHPLMRLAGLGLRGRG
ncbi:hypothetical protein [Phenylobacterium sp.]|uniref:hypothetical protein n=1 Tax=Phenylobacterium sp. TaxID=1871053 RepID=UPI00391BFD84